MVETRGERVTAPATATVLVAGDSHTFAMGAPKGSRGPIRLVSKRDGLDVVFLTRQWIVPEDEPYWNAVVEHSANRSVVISYNGNQHEIFLFAPPFDFIDDYTTAPVQPGAVLLPRSMILEHFKQTCVALGPLVRRIRQAGAAGVAILGTPAVIPDISRRMEVVKRIAGDRKWNASRLKPISPHVRAKLWRALQDVMREIALGSDAVWVPVPPETLDTHGFLPKCYWGSDALHGNDAYGKLMLELALEAIR